jgi:alkylated DNA nucleotide flippase Atl1
VNIVARAYAEREAETGKCEVAWWRVLRGDGSLNPKLPGGIAEQRRRLAEEGIAL